MAALRAVMPAVVAALAAGAAWPAPAVAHAVLERALPAPGSAIATPPDQVVLVFSEPIEPRFSAASVRDARGQSVSGPAQAGDDGRTLLLPLSELPTGIFTVRWRVLSAVDGHVTSGAHLFGVGESPAQGGAAAQPRPELDRVLARWLALAAGLVLAGAVAARLVVFEPAARRLAPPLADLLRARLRAVTRAAGTGVAVVLAVDLLHQVHLVAAQAAGSAAVAYVWASRAGQAALGGIAAALVASRGAGPLAIAGAGGVLLAFTVTAHAPAAGPLAVAADWLHLAGVSAWLGGLAVLVFVVRRLDDAARTDVARAVVRSFSRLAAAGLLVTAGTGLYAAWLQVPALRALVTTTYGVALHVKVLLLIPLLAFAAVNRFLLRPQLERHAHAELARRFVRSASGEVSVAAIIVLAAGVLTTTPPAKNTYDAGVPTAALLVGLAGETRVRLIVAPARPGRNRYEVVLDGARPEAAGDLRVLLRLVKLDEDLTPTSVVLTPAAGGQFEGQGDHLAAAGWWEVEVVVRRRGLPDVSTFFPLVLGDGLVAQRDPEAMRLLQEAREAPLGAWREWEQVTDGAGSLVVTQYRLAPPDRLHLRSRYELAPTGATGQTEIVVIGDQRYERRDSGPWTRATLRQPVIAEGHRVYLKIAEHVAPGREGRCDDEPCRVVLWTNPGGSPAFAAWIGQRTLRVHRLYMRAPAHYMTVRPSPPGEMPAITAPR
ncbi:MAG: copper resistance protein CopC [Armatimonadota bacterium]|nr:copper resistance protein CopC [Armatimonadota bacterium]